MEMTDGKQKVAVQKRFPCGRISQKEVRRGLWRHAKALLSLTSNGRRTTEDSKRLSKIMSHPAGFCASGESNCVISYTFTNQENLNKKGAHEQKAVSWRVIGSSVCGAFQMYTVFSRFGWPHGVSALLKAHWTGSTLLRPSNYLNGYQSH